MRVVDRVGQGVQRLAVGPHDDVVRHRTGSERQLAAHQVGERDALLGHPDAQHRLAALGAVGGPLLVGQVPVEAVVAQLGVAPGGAVARLDLLGRGERLVGVPGLEQASRHVGVDVHPLGLPVRPVGTADLDALVPVQAEPAQRVQQLLVALLGVPCGVGVLDPEHERAAHVPGVGPVEQGGAHHPDVRHAGGRRAEPDPDVGAGGGGGGGVGRGGAGHDAASVVARGRSPDPSISPCAAPGCAARRSPRPRTRPRRRARSGRHRPACR